MKIVVNTRFLMSGRLEGFGRFTYETLSRIVRAHPETEFHFLFDRPYDPSFVFADNVIPKVLPPPARHPLLFRIWFGISVRRYLNRVKPDVFVSPDGFLSLKWPGKQLAVIHDLSFEHYPEDIQRANRNYLKRFFPKFARRANRIATVSQYSASDLVKTYGIAPDRIDVVYNAASDRFHPVGEPLKAEIKKDLCQGSDFFVYLGALHPRKNIARMLQAYDLFCKENGDGIKLVIIGEKHWWDHKMKTVFDSMRSPGNVIFTGHLESERMIHILGSALALVYVSYFEGFGIPIIEAMKCGVPVVSGNLTSLPEVGGDAAVYVDPFNTEDILNGLKTVAHTPTLRAELIEKGYKQAEKFNWDNSAERLWESIQKTCEQT